LFPLIRVNGGENEAEVYWSQPHLIDWLLHKAGRRHAADILIPTQLNSAIDQLPGKQGTCTALHGSGGANGTLEILKITWLEIAYHEALVLRSVPRVTRCRLCFVVAARC